MNEWQLVHGHWAFLPPPGLLLLHSMVEQALQGHSIIHHQHSAVMSKGNSFRHMEFICPSAMHVYSSSLPMYFMQDIGLDPIKKIEQFYFPPKNPSIYLNQ
jgi:hypothetical protein